MNIEIFKIKLIQGSYAKDDWECVFEVPADYCLDDLHLTIQELVDFDNDHMYEFRIGRTHYSRNLERFCSDEHIVDELLLSDLIQMIKGKKLFYMFDYGDSWFFQISKSRKKGFAAKAGVEYPRIVEEIGIKPKQYPAWDDDYEL